jgi:uncharacterized SAM-binding protein YcdF (DUF218 family)
MFIASKLFTAFFLPPGLFITILIFLGWFKPHFRKPAWMLALFFYVLTINATSSFPLKWLESHSKPSTNRPPIAVVVLGGGVGVGHPNLPLSSDGLKRALVGLNYAKVHDLPLFYSGGGHKEATEAHGFLQSIEYIYNPFNISIPPTNPKNLDGFGVVLEDKSRDTFENAQFIASKLPPKSPIALVTSAYHLPRSKIIFEHFGFEVLPIATDFKRDYPENLEWRDWLPTIDGLQRNYILMHEIVGILSLLPRGVSLL